MSDLNNIPNSESPVGDTRYVHAHRGSGLPESPVSPPLVLSTTFRRAANGLPASHVYSRLSCPNRDAFESAMCALEQGSEAFAFTSGLAASMAIFQTLRPGQHVVIPDDIYYGVRLQLEELLGHFGIRVTQADMSRPDQLQSILAEPVHMVWIETPSNPLLKISDISAIVAMARECGALVVVDNTWATPLLQQPLQLGCDIVLHSATKYIGGHSDVMAGCVVVRGNDELRATLRRIQTIGGAVPSPASCWAATRGLQTLPVRVRAACHSAARIAEYCQTDSRIERVLYPGLPTHEGYHIAARQMSLPGAMLSICVRGDAEQALAVAGALRLFAHATSLGGVESLVEHRASIEPADSTTPRNLLRISVGLEDCNDLLSDLQSALSVV